MDKTTITLTFDDKRLEALEIFLKKAENTTVQKKLDEALRKLYEETVPEPVQEFIDGLTGAKPKRPASPPKPKPKPAAQEGQAPSEQEGTENE